jgi:hypothetical protein
MAGYLYILRSSKSGHYYIGSTNEPERRLHQHNTDGVICPPITRMDAKEDSGFRLRVLSVLRGQLLTPPLPCTT